MEKKKESAPRDEPKAGNAITDYECGPDCPCRPDPLDMALDEPSRKRGKTRQAIYLDHASTTPIREEVAQTMSRYQATTYGHPASVHKVGQKAKKALELARDIVAACLGASPREIYFTSGGTESNNLAIKGVTFAARDKGRHIITTKVEHHAVLQPCNFLEENGCQVTYLPVDRGGIVDLQALQDAIRDDTVLVSIGLANSETGVVQPIREVAAITREKGIPLHTNAAQAIGKVPVNCDDLGVDLVSVSAHKFNGPKGTGALYVRTGVDFAPLFHGGSHERNKRPGTENLVSIIGMAKAMGLAMQELVENAGRLEHLRNRLEQKLTEAIPGVHVNGHSSLRLPHILNLSFEGVDGEALLLTLDSLGIAVSTGSACTSGSLEPSHVLEAMQVAPALEQGSLRISFGRGNTEEEIDTVANVLTDVVARLREMSPLYSDTPTGTRE